jgi:hypothetical protein
VSGRPLQSWNLATDGATIHPVDLAVAGSGAVLVLSRDGRLLRVRAGRASAETVAQPTGDSPSRSLALTAGDNAALVARDSGLFRVDLAKGATVEIGSAAEVPLTGLERLRAHRNGFVAWQRGPDGQARLTRLELSRNGRRVNRAVPYDVSIGADASPAAFTVTDDEFALVVGGSELNGEAATSPSALGPPAELVVRRIRVP